MTVVVTGASGHIGANLVRALTATGRPVRALVHTDRRALAGLDIETCEGDICAPESLVRAFSGAEVVYHLAATISLIMEDWPRLEAVNVSGTRNVVAACLKAGVKKLVHFSSIHAFAPVPPGGITTEACPQVDSARCPPYDRSKAAGEREVLKGREQGLETVIINPTAIIGPYDYQPSHFGSVLLSLVSHRLPALVTGGYDWVDVRDVVAGAISAEQSAPSGAKYLLSGHNVSVREVAATVAEIAGVPAPGFVCPIWLARVGAPFVTVYNRITGGRPLYTAVSLRALDSNRLVSHEKATREIGYTPRPFRETISDTLQWFAENGYIHRQSNRKIRS